MCVYVCVWLYVCLSNSRPPLSLCFSYFMCMPVCLCVCVCARARVFMCVYSCANPPRAVLVPEHKQTKISPTTRHTTTPLPQNPSLPLSPSLSLSLPLSPGQTQ